MITLINIPLLSWTPGNNSVFLKYATTYTTADRGTAHELRSRLFLILLSTLLYSRVAPLHSRSLHSYSVRSLTSFRLTIQEGVWDSVTSQVLHKSHDESHDRCGKIVHRPYSSYISSIENLTETLLSFSC